MNFRSVLVPLLLVVAAAPVARAQDLVRRHPPTMAKDVFPAPDTGPEVKEAIKASMEVKGWGALPTQPGDLIKELGGKVELCRHQTDFGHGNYAYTVTCFTVGKEDNGAFLGEDAEYQEFFKRKWNGKRAALRAMAISGGSVIVEQFHSVLVSGDDAFIWMLVATRDGCKHPRYWRLVRVNKNKGDLVWVGDDMQEAGGEPKDLKGKCINVDRKKNRFYQ